MYHSLIYVEIFGKKWYVNIFFSSIASLKCTPSDRQMYPWGYMYPSLGTPVLEDKLVFCFLQKDIKLFVSVSILFIV